MKTMTIMTLTLIAAATVGAATAVPAPAQGSFQSPSGKHHLPTWHRHPRRQGHCRLRDR
jgi:hypothetical protein